ncbi:MAG: hypothetical protein HY695_29650 [Deltaproteobacteria bacterium]|nr:hypothetical protein [Deltaproteobacteria bacterium]
MIPLDVAHASKSALSIATVISAVNVTIRCHTPPTFQRLCRDATANSSRLAGIEACPISCGIDVYVENSRVTKTRDREDHLIKKLCPKGPLFLDSR